MSATQKFFRFLFGQTGDRTAVPDATALDGSVSYQDGYGYNYQRAKVDPLAMNIERDKLNQVLYDLTLGVHQYQTHGFPEYIQPGDNGGAAFSYDAGAVVLYTDGLFYQSLVAVNVALPTDATKWTPVSVNRGKVTLNANGNFTVPAGVTTLWATACAGGGGGGGAAGNNGTANSAGGGGGGGAGQFLIKQAYAVVPGQVIACVVGASGVGGAAGGSGASGTAGGTGGNTVIGALATLNGGVGGGPGSLAPAAGGGGGSGAPTGSAGGDGAAGAYGGAGASGPLGGGGGSPRGSQGAPINGVAAVGYGAGGAGGGATYTAVAVTGGAGAVGAPGVIILEW